MNDWVNSRETGDLRRQRACYDVIVMMQAMNVHLPLYHTFCMKFLFDWHWCFSNYHPAFHAYFRLYIECFVGSEPTDFRWTHWGRNKMIDMLQMTLPNAFSWMKNFRIYIEISLKFNPKGPTNNIPVLVPIMAWRRLGDRPLSETMMVRSLTHTCAVIIDFISPFSHHQNWHQRNSLESHHHPKNHRPLSYYLGTCET